VTPKNKHKQNYPNIACQHASTHFKVLKRIFLRYIKGTIDLGLFYGYCNSFDIVDYNNSDWIEDMDDVDYNNSDWVRDMNDKKIIIGFVFNMRETTFIWNSKNQSIITLSTYEAIYVAIIACVYHFIWLRRLLKKLRMPQKKTYKDLYEQLISYYIS